MASGFIILPDGRCLAPVWAQYDAVISAVASKLSEGDEQLTFGQFLLGLIPGPNDEPSLGFGPWVRHSDGESVQRLLDLRELTPTNQILFVDAAILAAHDLTPEDRFLEILRRLVEMIECMRRGEPPLENSMWNVVAPSEGRRVGPGWDVV